MRTHTDAAGSSVTLPDDQQLVLYVHEDVGREEPLDLTEYAPMLLTAGKDAPRSGGGAVLGHLDVPDDTTFQVAGEDVDLDSVGDLLAAGLVVVLRGALERAEHAADVTGEDQPGQDHGTDVDEGSDGQ